MMLIRLPIRSHWILFLTCVAGLVQAAHAQPLDCACNDYQKSFATQIRAVEDARYLALTENDWKALDTLLSDDLVYIHSTGVAQSKGDFTKALESGALRYRKITAEPTAIRFFGDVGVLNGRGNFEVTTRDGDVARDLTANLIYTAVYALRGEGLTRHWELVSWQSGAAAQPKQ
jgi:hypothetical protein